MLIYFKHVLNALFGHVFHDWGCWRVIEKHPPTGYLYQTRECQTCNALDLRWFKT
jgi:hypothetical protein